MSLISSHLEQISISAESIANLPFPPPGIFANALLAPHDITALIRDTEAHEHALFSVPPPPPPSTSQHDPKGSTTNRRQTVFSVASGEVTSSATASRGARRNTAVAAVLGPDLNAQIQRNENLQRGEIDVEMLLRGAEKLGEVYQMDGTKEKIAILRTRHARVRASLAHYEAKVATQSRELERMNRPEDWEGNTGDEKDNDEADNDDEEVVVVTDEDLRKEEDEIQELEKRKKELEDRVSGMERDLGGLLR